MKVLLVTEKCSPIQDQRDGGARLVSTMQRAFGDSLSIMQFGQNEDSSATWYFEYPFNLDNRFERRLANAPFIIQQVKALESAFTHVIFIHISMQFGIVDFPLSKDIVVWTFPMFLTPSYVAAGEFVPESYTALERLALAHSKNILTPSHLEKRQLMDYYFIPEEQIHVVPRGIDKQLFTPKTRSFCNPLKLCSIGSIKPQKNTLGLLKLFSKIHSKFPQATLKIVGPIQNDSYFEKVENEIQRLELSPFINFTGYIVPDKIAEAIADTHIHISTSTCETFGRAIFETLACGLPNIARRTGNAAAEFLKDLPYAKFVDDDNAALTSIEEMLTYYEKLSSMALEVGILYDDELLSKLLIATICKKEFLAISDFDGTLFHKNDPEKTQRCIAAFHTYPKRILCSARPLHDLLIQLDLYKLKVDWIVAYSGAIVTDGTGKLLWYTPLSGSLELEKKFPQAKKIEHYGELLQIETPVETITTILGLRLEIYQNSAYISQWGASKFRAVHRLLRHINWFGRVRAFGDGPYDEELLTYFDGVLITDFSADNKRQKTEVINRPLSKLRVRRFSGFF
jgi:glycosyltransferase involved in cell wall biosynthesis